MDFWAKAIQSLESMEYTCSSKNLTPKERRPPSLVNWVRTLRNIRDLWVNLRSQGMKHLSLRNLNQDPLENKFGCIRSYGFRNNSPTCTNFVGAYKSLILNDMVASHSVGANCEEDDCEVLDNLKNYLFSSVSSGPSTSSLPGTIENTDGEGVFNESMAFTAPSTVDSTISDESAGELLRKLGSFQCAECLSKQSATAWDPSFQGRIAPSKKFSDTYKFATILIYKYLPDVAHQLGVGSILRSRLLSCIDFQNLACDEHYVHYGQKYCRHVVNTTVVAWCNSVNSYLSGKRCTATEAMDVIHALAFDYFRRKRGVKY